MRVQVGETFARRFWYEEGGHLYDVIDVDGVPGQNDASLRPNQLLAASLTHDLLSETQTRSMLQQVTDHLLTQLDFAPLTPEIPAYLTHLNATQVHPDTTNT